MTDHADWIEANDKQMADDDLRLGQIELEAQMDDEAAFAEGELNG